MPASKPATPKPLPAIKVPYKTLVGLLGKSAKDPVVVAAMAKAGNVSFQSSYIIAKDAGFDFSLGQPEGAKRNAPKVLTSLFLFPDGADKHRGYADLPSGFAFVPRAELLAKLPAPDHSWKLGKGKVPASTPGVMHDTWTVDGFLVRAVYGNAGDVRHINVSTPASEEQDLATHPLHFETKPVDAPPDAELVGMALLVAWAADRFGLPAKHASGELGHQLVKRAISPRTFLVTACSKTLTSADFAPQLGDFLYEYENTLIDDEGARDRANKAIAKLLHLDDADRRNYNDDFLGTFAKAVDNPFHVPDSWAAVDRIAPVIDARLADFKATHFESAPDLALYEKAAKLRDKVAVTGDRASAGPAAALTDDALADDLVALIGKPLKDPHVKTTLTRAGMPIGKKIDQQANPALGVAYMGTKFDIGGKHELGVDAVWFYAAKQTSYIRGIGAEVEFAAYPGKLPRGLELGMSRADVAKLLGKPKTTSENTDYWYPTKQLQLNCEFKRGKLVELYIGQNKDY